MADTVAAKRTKPENRRWQKAREKLGFTVVELAAALQVTPSTMFRWLADPSVLRGPHAVLLDLIERGVWRPEKPSAGPPPLPKNRSPK